MILEQMAQELGLSSLYITSMARSASYRYKTFQIAKRSGGLRTIHHPSKPLKGLQRWLLANVIESWLVHPAAAAYRPKKSIWDNASKHAASRFLLRMDFADFFPSITEKDILYYISERASLFSDWTDLDKTIFCMLVCRQSALTIGAPTSPALSNAICYDMDAALDAACTKNGVIYTRYADDLFFSTNRPKVLGQIETDVTREVSRLKTPGGLRINTSKTRHSSKKGARRVTGIVLGSDGQPCIGRKFKRRIRSMIYELDWLDEPAKASLRGMIAYARGMDADFMNSLIMKYGLERVREASTPAAVAKD